MARKPLKPTATKCGDCVFFADGTCRLSHNDVGFFDEGCADFQRIDKPALTKVCKACGRELPLHKFSYHPKTSDHKMNICKECLSANHTGGNAHTTKADHKKVEVEELDEVLDKAEPMATIPVAPRYETSSLEEYTAQQIFDELKRRGFEGELRRTEILT